MAKRVKKGKAKIHYWYQMRDKLKDKFLPSHHLHDDAWSNANKGP